MNYYHNSDFLYSNDCKNTVQEKIISEESYSYEEESQNINFDSFEVVRELGTGSFGKVFEVIRKNTEEKYALKVLCKTNLNRHNQLKYAIAECKILKELKHPFIIPLY